MGFRTGFYGSAGRDGSEALRLQELGRPEQLRIRLTEQPSGRCLALLDHDDPERDRALVIFPNANDMAGGADLEGGFFLQAKWVHLTSFVSPGPLQAQIELVERIAGRVRVSFDPGAVYVSKGMAALTRLLAKSDVVFTSVEELHELCGTDDTSAAVSGLVDLGVEIVVVKMGADGIDAYTHGEHFHCPALPPAGIVDRTGAGDVAAAGFLAGMMVSAPVEKCLELAATAASRSIEGYGRTSYPDASLFGTVMASDRGALRVE